MLPKTSIIADLTAKPTTVAVPGGRTLFVRPWTTVERQAFQTEHRTAGDDKLPERLFVRSVCDELGTLLFTPSDLDTVSGLHGVAVEAVAMKAIELNGFAG